MKQAVILAAGEGRRLRPFTVSKPKVMLSIAGKPILHYVVESLAENGIRNIVLIVGYRKEHIFDYFGSGEQLGVSIDYVTQERQLGTGHALLQGREIVQDEFLVVSGDKLIEAGTIARFITMRPNAILVKRVKNPNRYSVVKVEGDLVRGIIKKPAKDQGNMINTGIYAFSKEIFNFVEAELDIPNALDNMIAQDYPVYAQETEGTWLDVVYPWDMLLLNEAVLQNTQANLGGIIETSVTLKGLVSVGKDTLIRSNSYIAGPVVIGDNCEIGPNVCILPVTSVGDNVVISPFTEISNSVLGDDVNIGPSCIIQDSIIERGCVIKGHFTACSDETEVKVGEEHHLVNVGAMLGEDCRLGSGVVAQPGVVVGNRSQVRSLKLISGRLPDGSLVF